VGVECQCIIIGFIWVEAVGIRFVGDEFKPPCVRLVRDGIAAILERCGNEIVTMLRFDVLSDGKVIHGFSCDGVAPQIARLYMATRCIWQANVTRLSPRFTASRAGWLRRPCAHYGLNGAVTPATKRNQSKIYAFMFSGACR
jgi:hypothetical protein